MIHKIAVVVLLVIAVISVLVGTLFLTSVTAGGTTLAISMYGLCAFCVVAILVLNYLKTMALATEETKQYLHEYFVIEKTRQRQEVDAQRQVERDNRS